MGGIGFFLGFMFCYSVFTGAMEMAMGIILIVLIVAIWDCSR